MPDVESFQFVGLFRVVLVGVGLGWLLTLICLWDRFDRAKDPQFIHVSKDILNATVASVAVGAVFSVAINVTIWLPTLQTNVTDSIRSIVEPQTTLLRPLRSDVTRVADSVQRILESLESQTILLTDLRDGVTDLRGREQPQVDVDLGPLRSNVTRVADSVQGILESLEEPDLSLVDEIVAAESAGSLTDSSFTTIIERHFEGVGVDGQLSLTIPTIEDTTFLIGPGLSGSVRLQ